MTTLVDTASHFSIDNSSFCGISSTSSSINSLSRSSELCTICGVKKRCVNSATCSRRCLWFGEGLCPQCGRSSRGSTGFCCYSCACVSAQANWCPGCHVRQVLVGQDHCSDTCAMIAPHVDTMKRRPKKLASASGHTFIEHIDDRNTRRALQLTDCSQPIARVLQVNVTQQKRRHYLNYRNAVEQRLTTMKLAKVGHGGEGNELRRYVPLRLTCLMGSEGVQTEPCLDAQCEVCFVLRNSFSLCGMWKASHYCTTTVGAAYPWAVPSSQSGVRAVAAVRAVIGFPQLLQSSDDIGKPWEDGFDSVLVTNGNSAEDGTYLFSDSAIDPQYIIFLN